LHKTYARKGPLFLSSWQVQRGAKRDNKKAPAVVLGLCFIKADCQEHRGMIYYWAKYTTQGERE
jgi:hypothetical protein